MAQRIFIDNLAGYRALPPCAERPVHVIVKDMASGCGDGQRTTSYGCFCSTSSTQFVSIISKEVAKRCLPDTATAVAQATDLFGSYCAIGSAANGTAGQSSPLIIESHPSNIAPPMRSPELSTGGFQ
ncbi:hypothetical protein PG995_013321 [Apiospora arundinis]